MCYIKSLPSVRSGHALLTGALGKQHASLEPLGAAPDPLAAHRLDVWEPLHHMSQPIEELATMNTGDDEPSSGLNGRLRPRKSIAPSPQGRDSRKPDGKLAPDKPKRTSTPSRAPAARTDDGEEGAAAAAPALCPYCERRFAGKQAAVRHARRAHASGGACLFCAHAELAPRALFAHMVARHAHLYFACSTCLTRFATAEHLAEHKLVDCENPKPHRAKMRQKTAPKRNPKKNDDNIEVEVRANEGKYQESRGFNGVVISCELKPSRVHDAADIEDNIPTNVILPPGKGVTAGAVIEKSAVIVLDDIQWNKRIPASLSFHSSEADQILSRLGVVHRSPRGPRAGSPRRDWLRAAEPGHKFERCFDTAFYCKVASNVHENLAKFLDGSFNFNPDPDATISTRRWKNSVAINTAEGFPVLLASAQYSRGAPDALASPRAVCPRHKWKWDSLDAERALLSAEQRARDSHLSRCIISLVARLDMWTQLRMRQRFDDHHRRAPLEKKAEKRNTIGNELKEILESRQIPAASAQPVRWGGRGAARESAFPAQLGLAPAPGAFSVPPAVLSGEWVRPRCYVCCACGVQARDGRALGAHMVARHPNAHVQHYEVVGEPLLRADIVRHLYVPPAHAPARTRPLRGVRDCTKCARAVPLEELHAHMLECAGDVPATRRRARARPFGVRRRRPRLPDNTIRRRMRSDLRRAHRRMRPRARQRPAAAAGAHTHSAPRIRTEVGDAETIRKMIADLPAKRHRVVVNPALRPGRKHDQRRTRLLMQRRSADESKNKKLSATTDTKVCTSGGEHAAKDDNDNGSNKDDEDNLPLKPRVKRVATKTTRRTDTIKRSSVLNRAKRKVQMKSAGVRGAQDGEPTGTYSGGQGHRSSGERTIARGGGREQAGASGAGGEREQAGARPQRDAPPAPAPVAAPPASAPLKHSIASLTADSETHDKSVQFHQTFLVQQECNEPSPHAPHHAHTLFENEAAASELDKPPLHPDQKEPPAADSAQKGKPTKPRKPLSYCIALLKSKLVEPAAGANQISVQCGNDEPLDPDPRFYVRDPPIDTKIDPKPAEIFSRSVILERPAEQIDDRATVPPTAPQEPATPHETINPPEPMVVPEILITPPKQKDSSSRRTKKSTVSQSAAPHKQKETPVKRKSTRLRSTAKIQDMYDLPSQLEIIPQKGKGTRSKRETQTKATTEKNTKKKQTQDRSKKSNAAKAATVQKPELYDNRNSGDTLDQLSINQERDVTMEQRQHSLEYPAPGFDRRTPSAERGPYSELRTHSSHGHATTDHKQLADRTTEFRPVCDTRLAGNDVPWAEHQSEHRALEQVRTEYIQSIHAMSTSEHGSLLERASYTEHALALERRRLSEHRRLPEERPLSDQIPLEYRSRPVNDSYMDHRMYSEYLDQMAYNEQMLYKEQNMFTEDRTHEQKKVTRRSRSKRVSAAEQRKYTQQYAELALAMGQSTRSNKKALDTQTSFAQMRPIDNQRLMESTSSLIDSRTYHDQGLLKDQLPVIDFMSVRNLRSITGQNGPSEHKTGQRGEQNVFDRAVNKNELQNTLREQRPKNKSLKEQRPLQDQKSLNRARTITDTRSPNEFIQYSDQGRFADQNAAKLTNFHDRDILRENKKADNHILPIEPRLISNKQTADERTTPSDKHLSEDKSCAESRNKFTRPVPETQTYFEQNSTSDSYIQGHYARPDQPDVYGHNNMPQHTTLETQSEQELSPKQHDEMYSDNEFVNMPAEIPVAHASTNVRSILSSPLDLSGKTLPLDCSEDLSKHEQPSFITNYDAYETLDLSNKITDRQRFNKETVVSDAVVDLRIKSSTPNVYQENTMDLRPKITSNEIGNISDLSSYTQCEDDYIPTDLSMRGNPRHDSSERRIGQEFNVQDLSSHKLTTMGILHKEFPKPSSSASVEMASVVDNSADEPTDLSGKHAAETSNMLAAEVPESKEICVSIDLTEDDDYSPIAKAEKDQHYNMPQVRSQSVQAVLEFQSGESVETKLNDEKNCSLVESHGMIDTSGAGKPIYEPTLKIPSYKIRVTASDVEASTTAVDIVTHCSGSSITASKHQSLTSGSLSSANMPGAVSRNGPSLQSTTEETDKLPYTVEPPPVNVPVTTVVRSLPVYTLPNPVISTVMNKHESTTPVYTLANACISVTKIETCSAATLTNTLLSIASSTIANTTSVYTLAGTTIGAPKNYDVIPTSKSPLVRSAAHNAMYPMGAAESVLIMDKQTKLDAEPTPVEKPHTSSSIEPDLEIQRKIAMLPKELVEILGTMPADHRNQLLNVLPQYVSTTTVATMHSETRSLSYTTSRGFSAAPAHAVAPTLPPSTSRNDVSSAECQTGAINMLPPSSKYQTISESSGSFDYDSKSSITYLLAPPPPPPPLPPLPPLPPPTSPLVSNKANSNDIKPAPLCLPNIAKKEVPEVTAIDEDKQIAESWTEKTVEKLQKEIIKDQDRENKIIDLTDDDGITSDREIMKIGNDSAVLPIIPTQQVTNYTSIVKSKQKSGGDKTSSLRAVRIKTQSERNKCISTETQVFTKTPIESEAQEVTRTGLEPETQIITKTTIESEIQIFTTTVMEPQSAMTSDPDDEVNKISESKKSLAIQQAEVSSTQHGSKNVVVDCKFPVGTSPTELETQADDSIAKSRRMSTPTDDIVVTKNGAEPGLSEKTIVKSGLVTSSITVNDKLGSENNKENNNNSKIKKSNISIDSIELKTEGSTNQLTIDKKDINTGKDERKSSDKLLQIDSSTLEEEDSDDDVSLAVIVKKKQRTQQKIVPQDKETIKDVLVNSQKNKKKEKNTKDKAIAVNKDSVKSQSNTSKQGDTVFFDPKKTTTKDSSRKDAACAYNETLDDITENNDEHLHKKYNKSSEHDIKDVHEHLKQRDPISEQNTIDDSNTTTTSQMECPTEPDKHCKKLVNNSEIKVGDIGDEKIQTRTPLQDNKIIGILREDITKKVAVENLRSKKKKKNSNKIQKNKEDATICVDSNMSTDCIEPRQEMKTDAITSKPTLATETVVSQNKNASPENFPLVSDLLKNDNKRPERTNKADISETLVGNTTVYSEIEENVTVPLRRSRRGKSMFVDSSSAGNESIVLTDTADTLEEQKAPLTKKQLIFSKLLLDEENNTGPSAHSTPEKRSTGDVCNISIITSAIGSYSSIDALPVHSISNTADVDKNKPPKRKTSLQTKRKFKKKKSHGNVDKESDSEISEAIDADTKSITLSASCMDVGQIPLPEADKSDDRQKQKDINVELDSKVNDDIDESADNDNIDAVEGDHTALLKLSMISEKRKLISSAPTEFSSKPKKSKTSIKVNLAEPKEMKSEDNNMETFKLSMKTDLTAETRKACYMPAARRTRSKSVVVKSSSGDTYDPYDIDLDDMIEDSHSIIHKKSLLNKITFDPSKRTTSQKQTRPIEQERPQTSTVTHTTGKSLTCSNSTVTHASVSRSFKYSNSNNETIQSLSYVKDYDSDSDDSSISDVPLKKYVEQKEKKLLASANVSSELLSEDDGDLDATEHSLRKQDGRQCKSRRTLATYNNLEKSSAVDEADEQLRSEQFMESFGFFSERKPRKSNLLASKKISETFHIIGNDSDDTYTEYRERTNKRSLQNENRKSVDADGRSRSHQQHSPSKKSVKRGRKKKASPKPLPCYCGVCKKDFRRPDNYLRHQMTLLHVSKLSEVEMKVKTVPVHEEPNYLIVYKQRLDRLKILTDKLAKKNKNSKSAPKIKLPTLDEILIEVNKTVREQQLSQRGLSRDEALFLDCCELLKSNKNEVSAAEPATAVAATTAVEATESTVKEFDLLDKPSRGDGDVDSLTAKNILESDEVRNLENDLISGLKEAASAGARARDRPSKVPYQRSVSDVGMPDDIALAYSSPAARRHYHSVQGFEESTTAKGKKQPEVKDKMYPDITDSIDMFEDKFDKIKRKCRSQAAQAKQAQPPTEPGTSHKTRRKSEKKKVKKGSKKSHQSTQVLTKGALKGFDGIKVSIPTSDINMSAIVHSIENSAKKKKKGTSKRRRERKGSESSEKYEDDERRAEGDSTPQKKVDVYEFMDNEDAELFEFRPSTLMERFKILGHKEAASTSRGGAGNGGAGGGAGAGGSDSGSDGDDFVYMSDDYVCSGDETESSLLSLDGARKNASPHKRRDALDKSALMGKIFKHNAVRGDRRIARPREPAKPATNLDQLFDSLLEDEPSSSVLRAEPPSPGASSGARSPLAHSRTSSPKRYDGSSASKGELSACENIDEFHAAVEYPPSISRKPDSKTEPGVSTSRGFEPTTTYESIGPATARRRDSSVDAGSDDELSYEPCDFNQKRSKEKSPSLKPDEGISTSYDRSVEALDEAGVARQRARRKCTVGKQNVLAETWSSESEPDGARPAAHAAGLAAARRRKGRRRDAQQAARRAARPAPRLADDQEEETPPPAPSGPRPRARAPLAWPAALAHAPDGAAEPAAAADAADDHVQQHGWIVGDSHKKLVTMLAHAKGRKRNNDDRRHLLE